MKEEVARGTSTLPVSLVGGPAAHSVARKIWETANDAAPVGWLTPTTESLPESDLAARLFHLTSAEPPAIIAEIKAIAESRRVDHLIIECDPSLPLMAYASLLAAGAQSFSPLNEITRLTKTVLAIRPSETLDLLLPGRTKSSSNGVCFIVEQLEFADHVWLDARRDDPDLGLATSLIRALNPHASLPDASQDAAASWLNSEEPLFAFDAALAAAEWRRLIEKESTPLSYPDGVTAFAYHARRPFHPERFWNLLQSNLRNVFRAKGFFWLAPRMDQVGGLNLAGAEVQCVPAGQWWAARDQETRDREMPERTRGEWREPFGDRRQAIALMSVNVEPALLRDQLDACLLTREEMAGGSDQWRELPDPFPSWSPHSHQHHQHHDHAGCDHHHEHEHGPGSHDCCHH
ncbi:MAG TPA: GTP-binding protein [Chthoniobacterales bacterium]|nr:GTP-binding protein [Chthoniobacterales bacterium]